MRRRSAACGRASRSQIQSKRWPRPPSSAITVDASSRQNDCPFSPTIRSTAPPSTITASQRTLLTLARQLRASPGALDNGRGDTHRPNLGSMRLPLLIALASLAIAPTARAALPPSVPFHLPPNGASAATARDTWLLGAEPGTRLAGGKRVGDAYEVPASQARELAQRLGDRLTFAEPNANRRFHAVAEDPLTPQSRWRQAVIPSSPAAGHAPSPLLALVDPRPRSPPGVRRRQRRALPGRR